MERIKGSRTTFQRDLKVPNVAIQEPEALFDGGGDGRLAPGVSIWSFGSIGGINA